MTGILGQLKWESLKKRRKDNRLILLYKGLKAKASVPTDDLIPKTRRCRNQHSMTFQTPIANTDVYKGSFFPQIIRDWNALPDSLISSVEDEVYQQMTLSPKLGVVGISTLWHCKLPLPIQMFINFKVASSFRLSGIGMPSPIL